MEVVLRCEKVKLNDLPTVENHNHRKYEKLSDDKKAKHIDPARANLNEYDQNSSVRDKVLKRLETISNPGALGRKGINPALEFVIQASPEFFYDDLKDPANKDIWDLNVNGSAPVTKFQKSLNRDLSERYFEKAKTWFSKEFGEENVIDLCVHYDEKTPHLHVVITPITSDNRLCAKEIYTPANARRWQTDFHAHVKEFGLERGKENSSAVHEDSKVHNEQLQNLPKPPQVMIPKITPPGLLTTGKKVYEQARLREFALREKYDFYKDFYTQNVRVVTKSKNTKDVNTKLEKENKTMSYKLKKYSDDDLEAVRSIELGPLLEKLDDFKITREGLSTRYKNEKFNIVVTGAKFIDNKSSTGGIGSIDLLTKLFDRSFKEAVAELKSLEYPIRDIASVMSSNQHKTELKSVIETAIKPVTLPEKSVNEDNITKVKRHLKQDRCLDIDLVEKLFADGLIYADRRNNAVFKTKDKNSAVASGTTETKFKRNYGSDLFEFEIKSPGSQSAPADLFVFESPIDALAFYTIHKRPGTYVSTNGNSAVSKLDIKIIEFDRVFACFDSDEKGKELSQDLKIKVNKIGHEFYRSQPTAKDFGDDLKIKTMEMKKQEEEIKRAQAPGKTLSNATETKPRPKSSGPQM